MLVSGVRLKKVKEPDVNKLIEEHKKSNEVTVININEDKNYLHLNAQLNAASANAGLFYDQHKEAK